jgi:hypothetical protein
LEIVFQMSAPALAWGSSFFKEMAALTAAVSVGDLGAFSWRQKNK